MEQIILNEERTYILAERFQESVCNELIDVMGSAPVQPFLFSTSSGVFFVGDGQVRRLLKGFCFGIAEADGWFYCTQEDYFNIETNNYNLSRILRFRLSGGNAVEVSVFCTALPPGIHHIAIWDGKLVHVQTNGVLNFFPLSSSRVIWGTGECESWNLADGQAPFGHVNSILIRDNDMVVLAHNDFERTGRNSVIKIVNLTGDVINTCELDVRSGHDLAQRNGELVICSSADCTVVCGDSVVAKIPNRWTRGLARVGDFWVVGGSEITDRSKRLETSSHLYFFDSDFKMLSDRLEIYRLPHGEFGGNVKCVCPL